MFILLSPHNVNFDDDNNDAYLDGDNDAQLDGDLRISQLKGFDHHQPLHLLIDSYQQQKISKPVPVGFIQGGFYWFPKSHF